MASAVYETTSVKVAADKYIFNASTSKLNFQGFMQVYTDSDSEKVTTDNVIAKLTKESELSLVEFNENQHFTQPPAHFTEAVLVKALEEQGIGRPTPSRQSLKRRSRSFAVRSLTNGPARKP